MPTDGLASLSLGFYPRGAPDQRVTAYDAAGNVIGDRLLAAAVRMHTTPAPPPPTQPPLATWTNGISLAAASVITDAAGLPAGVQVTWHAGEPVQTDYTVFVQALDQDDRVVAQVDRQPGNGAYPTSTWQTGDQITDTLLWGEAPATWRRIVIGFYDTAGQRLPLSTGEDVFVAAENSQ